MQTKRKTENSDLEPSGLAEALRENRFNRFFYFQPLNTSNLVQKINGAEPNCIVLAPRT